MHHCTSSCNRAPCGRPRDYRTASPQVCTTASIVLASFTRMHCGDLNVRVYVIVATPHCLDVRLALPRRALARQMLCWHKVPLPTVCCLAVQPLYAGISTFHGMSVLQTGSCSVVAKHIHLIVHAASFAHLAAQLYQRPRHLCQLYAIQRLSTGTLRRVCSWRLL